MTIVFRQAVPSDFPEVRRITRDAYLRAGHFAADHPYMSVLEDVEHRAEHAQVWVAETAGRVVAAVALTFAGQPYSEIATDGELEFRMLAVDPACQGGGVGRAVVSEIVQYARQLPGIGAISITSAKFMERAHGLYESLGFQPCYTEMDWKPRTFSKARLARERPVGNADVVQRISASHRQIAALHEELADLMVAACWRGSCSGSCPTLLLSFPRLRAERRQWQDGSGRF
ncbi:GNAT family N-acetyltransferase [Arthrobacter sp. D3-16]